jgi:hypothetical protein
MIIAIDFDGTCVTHEYPLRGKNIGAEEVLKKLQNNGHKLILWTMRDKEFLIDAESWFYENGLELYGIQRNPTQDQWTSSPKAYAQLYIDDAALGCPLLYPVVGRPHVDWQEVEKLLKQNGIIDDNKL